MSLRVVMLHADADLNHHAFSCYLKVVPKMIYPLVLR